MELLKWRKSQTGIIVIIALSFLTLILIILENPALDHGNPLYIGIFINIQNIKNVQKIQPPKRSVQPLKQILFWTPFYGHSKLSDYFIFQEGWLSQKSFCKYQCKFTTNRSLLNSSHVILFHGRDLESNYNGGKATPSDFPQHRNGDQYWIFYLSESPVHTFAHLEVFAGIFNLTLTYRRDSDIYAPYRRLLENSPNSKRMANIQEELKSKTKLVAWIVSNCHSTSGREALGRELGKYLHIDIFGACGNLSCPSNNNSNCYEEIGKSYKFYLSFENSFCYDYVTEKFFNALAVGMVPIVYGGADYSRHAPEGSFINVNSFPTVKALAKHILMLDQNPTEYLKYFEWKLGFYVDPYGGFLRAWCTLCEKLTTGTLPRQKVVKDLQHWWFHKDNNSSACAFPTVAL